MALDTAKAVGILRSLTHTFDRTLENAAQQVFYPRICNVVASDGYDEEYGWLGSMPAVREWLGDRQFNQLRASKFTLVNRHWEDSLAIEKNDLADDRVGIYRMAMPSLGERTAKHPDKLLFQLLEAADATLCHDGQFFFDTDHVWGSSGSQDNDLTANITTVAAPTTTEFLAAWDAMTKALLGFKDDNGEPLNQPTVGRLNDLLLIVPLVYRKIAYDSLEAAILSNNSNVIVDMPQIICSTLLASADRMYVIDTSGFLKPFVFQARAPITRQMKGLDDAETKIVKFMTEARYNIGLLAWWKAVQHKFT